MAKRMAAVLCLTLIGCDTGPAAPNAPRIDFALREQLETAHPALRGKLADATYRWEPGTLFLCTADGRNYQLRTLPTGEVKLLSTGR